jgi:hypothetical protein
LTLDDLLPKLQHKVERSCGGAAPDTSVLVDMLERTRFEYSTYSPQLETFDFTLRDDESRVTVTKNGDPADIVAAVGVYIEDVVPSFPLGQGFGAGTIGPALTWQGFEGSHAAYESREMPSILFTQARYRKAYYRAVSFTRNNHVFLIIRPPAMTSVTGTIVYGAAKEWDEIPRMDERIILDRSLAEFIDDTLISESAGVIRIPTPHGPFEFDGGRVLLSLRDRLIEDFKGRLMVRMSHLSSG